MKQTNLAIVLIGALSFIISMFFMMPTEAYNKTLFWLLLVIGISLVGIGLYLEEKEKKK